jgi:hypothetical protein
MILRGNIGFGRQKAAANGSALCARHLPLAHARLDSYTLLSFSSATQRQFAGEPNGSSPAPAVAAVGGSRAREPALRDSGPVCADKIIDTGPGSGLDRLFPRHGSPHQPTNLVYRRDLRPNNTPNNTQLTSTRSYLQARQHFMTLFRPRSPSRLFPSSGFAPVCRRA